MANDKVAEDDARQAASQDAAKVRAEKQVNAELARGMSDASVGTQGRVAEVAADMRHRAIDESEQGARSIGHARTAARGSQFIDFAFYALYALLGIRLVLAFIAWRRASGPARAARAHGSGDGDR